MCSTAIMRCYRCLTLMFGGFLAACSSSDYPATSPEGLVLQSGSSVAALYARPGASLKGYQEYGVSDCEVSFKRHWLRDQNDNRLDLGNRITQKDVDRIKDRLARECNSHFKESLQAPPAYNLVDNFDDGEKVLILRPSITNLDIAAPDTMSAGMSRTYTTSEGEMTIVLEVIDGTTGELLYRATDRRKAIDSGRLEWTNSVTNKAAADRALRRWAGQLRKALDKATAS